jgi:hypothetical protein
VACDIPLKALNEGYNFFLDLISIVGLGMPRYAHNVIENSLLFRCFPFGAHILVPQGVRSASIVMGYINFEGHELIKRRQVGKKMNAMGGRFKDVKNKVTIENCFHLLLEVMSIFEVLEFTTT